MRKWKFLSIGFGVLFVLAALLLLAAAADLRDQQAEVRKAGAEFEKFALRVEELGGVSSYGRRGFDERLREIQRHFDYVVERRDRLLRDVAVIGFIAVLLCAASVFSLVKYRGTRGSQQHSG